MRLKPSTVVLGFLILTLGYSDALLADSLVVRNLRIPTAVKLNNVILQPGSYQLKIYDRTQTAEIVLSRGDKVVVEAMADPSTLEVQLGKTALMVKPLSGDVPTVMLLEIAGDNRSYRFVQEKESFRASLQGSPQNYGTTGN